MPVSPSRSSKFGLAGSIGLAAAAQAVAGAGNTADLVGNDTLIQQLVPPAMLGRVFGALATAAQAGAGIAYAAAAPVVALAGPRITFLIAGAGMVAGLLVLVPALRAASQRPGPDVTPPGPIPSAVRAARLRRRAGEPLGAGIYVHGAAAQEPDQGQARLLGELGGQRRRRGHRGQDRDARGHGLLDELERGPSADQQNAAGQRQLPLAQRPADHLVDGIVPADVLAQRQQLAIGREQPGRVQPAGRREHSLRGAEPVRQPGQHGGPQPELIGGKIKIRQNG
jgi:hypothetical protein